MEVVEDVDNPAGFLRSCAELVKVRLARALIISSTFNSLFFFYSGLLARLTCFPLNDCAHAALLSSFDRSGREGASPRRAWRTYLFKFVSPGELIDFFTKSLTPGSRPWISRTYAHGLPTRLEAEVRGIIYVPWRGDWVLAPRATTPWSTQVNYLFWAQKPKD
jgi:2-polyprenyl-6-hydroxyphenyl methylase/3-demethylubiquinone-9 3-methyltransferase